MPGAGAGWESTSSVLWRYCTGCNAHCCVINVIIWHVMLLLSLAMLMFTEKIYELKTDEWWFDRKSKHV